MKYGLACTRVRIEHSTIAGVAYPLVARNLGGQKEHATKGFSIACLIERVHVLSRDHQDMNGRLWVDVPKSDAMLVLGDNRR